MATTASKTTAKSLAREIKNQTINLTDTINNELFSKPLRTQSKVEKKVEKLQNLIKQTSETMEQLFNDPEVLKKGVKGNCVFESYTKGDVTTIDFKFKASVKGR